MEKFLIWISRQESSLVEKKETTTTKLGSSLKLNGKYLALLFLKLYYFSSNESSAMKEMARSVGGSRELFQGLLSLAANEKTKQNTQKMGTNLNSLAFIFSLELAKFLLHHIFRDTRPYSLRFLSAVTPELCCVVPREFWKYKYKFVDMTKRKHFTQILINVRIRNHWWKNRVVVSNNFLFENLKDPPFFSLDVWLQVKKEKKQTKCLHL